LDSPKKPSVKLVCVVNLFDGHDERKVTAMTQFSVP